MSEDQEDSITQSEAVLSGKVMKKQEEDKKHVAAMFNINETEKPDEMSIEENAAPAE